jgi:hypothetical protein
LPQTDICCLIKNLARDLGVELQGDAFDRLDAQHQEVLRQRVAEP